MPEKLTIWSNAKFPPAAGERLVKELAPHRLIESAGASQVNLAAGKPDPQLEQADVALGQPDPGQVIKLPKLRLVQLTTAGYTRYDTPAFRDGVKRNGTIVSNASSVYAEPCAQHVLAMMLALARRLPQSMDNQRGPRAWPYLPLRAEARLLNGQTVLLVGYGTIARRLSELLGPLKVKVVGFRRHASEPNVLPIDQLDEWLPKADHIVNILPASDQTNQFFDANRFAKLKANANYYNIGRGTTNDEKALQRALETKAFAAAYIDAFATEPLPVDHPLWTTPNCFITPHTAGGHANEFDRHVDLIVENLRRFQRGDELIDRIM